MKESLEGPTRPRETWRTDWRPGQPLSRLRVSSRGGGKMGEKGVLLRNVELAFTVRLLACLYIPFWVFSALGQSKLCSRQQSGSTKREQTFVVLPK